MTVKKGIVEIPRGSVIMDVMNAEQAKLAEEAGASAVMALEKVPADIRAAGGVARMADPAVIEEVMEAVSIPVMAKARIGHYVEAKVLEALGVDYIDESEVLTPADPQLNPKLLRTTFCSFLRFPAQAMVTGNVRTWNVSARSLMESSTSCSTRPCTRIFQFSYAVDGETWGTAP